MSTLSMLADYGIGPAELPTTPVKLRSGVGALDDFLAGGLPFGTVTEWGAPLGRGGRLVVARFLAAATQGRGLDHPAMALWVRPANSPLCAYAPAWRAQGVNLARVRFAHSARPVAELKPLFLDPLFKLIVLDCPEKMSPEDIAYLARQARVNGQLIVLLRNYMLSSERGNVWARLRLNCWVDPLAQQPFRLQVIRGFSFRRLDFALDDDVS